MWGAGNDYILKTGAQAVPSCTTLTSQAAREASARLSATGGALVLCVWVCCVRAVCAVCAVCCAACVCLCAVSVLCQSVSRPSARTLHALVRAHAYGRARRPPMCFACECARPSPHAPRARAARAHARAARPRARARCPRASARAAWRPSAHAPARRPPCMPGVHIWSACPESVSQVSAELGPSPTRPPRLGTIRGSTLLGAQRGSMRSRSRAADVEGPEPIVFVRIRALNAYFGTSFGATRAPDFAPGRPP